MSDSTRFYLLSLAKTNFFDTIIISRINKKKSYRNFKKGGYLQLEKVFVTKDISPGGIRFYVQEFIPKDKILEIKISIGNPSFMLKAMVKVVWIKIELYNNRYEVGAKFEKINRDALDRLTYYLDSENR